MNIRYLIFAAMFAVAFVLLQNWSKFSDEHYQAQQLSEATQQSSSDTLASDAPKLTAPVVEEKTLTTQSENNENSNLISVETPVLSVKIDLVGGDVVYAALKEHKNKLGSEQPFVVLENNAKRVYALQSGLIGENGTHNDGVPTFTSAQTSYQLTGEQPNLSVVLSLVQNGVEIQKIYTFQANDYLVNVDYKINNKSATKWNAHFYGQIKRDNSVDPASEQGGGGLGMQPFLGFATHNKEEKFDKYDFEDIDKQSFKQSEKNSWIAMIQHYFLSAWIAPKDIEFKYNIEKRQNNIYVANMISPAIDIAPGSSGEFNSSFYVGPKDQYRLRDIADGLDLSVDYSFLWWIAQPLYGLLNFFATGKLNMFGLDKQIFPGFGNWGVAIILLTLLVKILFFRLNQKAYTSMARMKKFAPKMKDIRDRFPDDRQKQSQAMMELYKKEKINPMGGCLPMLIQMPVFFALYWVIMECVDLRHAPFFGWIQDLSTKDPLFILPILMGASMWFQQKLNPAPSDPMQAKVMQWLPIIFTFFFLFFPAGLVLYWVVNNILSIAQQWIINRQIENSEKKATASAS